jgi:mono/diheme cytochrome c family protein
MTRVFAKAATGFALVFTLCAVAWSITGSARQARAVSAGVYAAAQAERVAPLYQQRCAQCHGSELQGASVGSPLTGPDFLANWSGRPLADLVDKIHKTMPFDMPGSLSRQQSIDLAARILQAARFPAGRAELSEGELGAVRLPTVRAAAPPAARAAAAPPPLGNLAELMRAIAFYNSNIVFNLQLGDPASAPKKQQPIPFDYVEWGYTIYPGWMAVDQAAVALTETAYLLSTPGRRCQNGRPVPLERADWQRFVDDLAKVGKDIYAASKARNYEQTKALSENLNTACANCHQVYRDGAGLEGSGAVRCQVTP